MQNQHFDLLESYISPTYLSQGIGSRNHQSKLITELLTQRRLPENGWTQESIELFIREVSLWDSNNFPEKAAVGEREGRCISQLVRRRHWGLTHGIGRSGDVNAEQPKAAGSSFLLKLTRQLVRDFMKTVCGIVNIPKEVVVLPVATGMGLMLGMTALTQVHRDVLRRNVIWSRIDQKTCIKSLTYDPNLRVHVVEQTPSGEGLVTNMGRIWDLIEELGPNTIHSIVLTTSTFAPRTPDDVPTVAKLCKEENVPLIVNNAYGLQCTKCCHLINEALRVGRVDLVVQSTDKNFAVPVGGSILFGPLAERANRLYPGRASMSPVLDLLITLLEVGSKRYSDLLRERRENLNYLETELNKIDGVRVLSIPKNQISLAVVSGPDALIDDQLGADLFLRNVSGSRVFVRTDKSKTFEENIPPLTNFGCHSSLPVADRYMNVACAIGVTREELGVFLNRFRGLMSKRKHLASTTMLDMS